MKHSLDTLLRQATDLTRRGDPAAATRAIRQALGGSPPDDGVAPRDFSAGRAGPPSGGSLRDFLTGAVDAARAVADSATGPGPGADGGLRGAFEAHFGSVPGGSPTRPGARPAPAARDLPDGARVLRGTHASRHGTRDWRLYVPSAAARAGAPLPLVVMLHGCTQDADDFARGTRMDAIAEAAGAYALYPEQSSKANPQRCWNWFKHTHQDLAHGEPAIIAGMIDQVAGDHRVDAARVFAAGLSAGGAMAAILGECAPERFAGIGVHSGLGAGSASDMPSAFAAMQGQGGPVRAPKVPTIVFHGDADSTVACVNAERLVDALVRDTSGALARTASVRVDGRECERTRWSGVDGAVACETWTIRGAGHAWSGGDPAGSYTDATGPDASRLMMDFFAACAAGSTRAA